MFSKKTTPLTLSERSQNVKNVFINSLNEYTEINNEIELRQGQIKSEVEELQSEESMLENLKKGNSRIVKNLSALLNIEDNG